MPAQVISLDVTDGRVLTDATKQGLRLNLGAGGNPKDPGWLNCDLNSAPNIDLTFDLQGKWPFPDHSVAEMYSCHVLEHLADFKTFFLEAYRCLQPNGTLLIRVPYGGHRSAWFDWSHLRPWFAESFAALQPGYGESVGNPQHRDTDFSFGLGSVQLRVSYRLARWLRRWWVKKLFCHINTLFDAEIEELWVFAYALKTQDAIDHYKATHKPNMVPVSYSAWKHHLTDEHLEPFQQSIMVDLMSGLNVTGYLHNIQEWEKKH